jgi:DNA-binding response OmpR family regulator
MKDSAHPMNANPTATLLVVEDDARQLRLYSKALEQFELVPVTSGTEAMATLARRRVDLVILDHVLAAGELGLDFLPKIKAAAAHVPVIVISGTLDVEDRLRALQGPRSAHYFIEKPVKLDVLERTVAEALRECGLGEAVRMLKSLEHAEQIESNDPERRFTERLDRQHQILNLLRAAERPSVSALARQFSTSRRTIRRDLNALIQRGQIARDLFAPSELAD